MSRIGNKVIQVPAGVTVTLSPENYAVVKGPKGQLEFQFNQSLDIKMEGADITISRPNNEIFTRKIHGTTRALLANMIIGVSTGFKKQLEIRGVGYRASLTGNVVNLSLGYSHPIELEIPAGLKVTIPKNTDVIVEGADKQLVGEFSAKIRSFRKP
ncbi:MAG: 50S ribosomal protein L6, partial [Tenericutes bacterium GWE2_38_8]